MLRHYISFPLSHSLGIFFTWKVLLLTQDIWLGVFADSGYLIWFLALLQTSSLTFLKSVSIILLRQKRNSSFTDRLFILIPLHFAFAFLAWDCLIISITKGNGAPFWCEHFRSLLWNSNENRLLLKNSL